MVEFLKIFRCSSESEKKDQRNLGVFIMIKSDQKDSHSDDKELAVEEKIVVFTLSGERYGIRINQVKEIAPYTTLTKIPNAPDYILGLMDLRGEILMIIDLEKNFGLQRKEDSSYKEVIIFNLEESKSGVVVDKVNEIIGVDKSDIQPPEAMIKQKIDPAHLDGMIIYRDQVLVILNISHLMNKQSVKDLVHTQTNIK